MTGIESVGGVEGCCTVSYLTSPTSINPYHRHVSTNFLIPLFEVNHYLSSVFHLRLFVTKISLLYMHFIITGSLSYFCVHIFVYRFLCMHMLRTYGLIWIIVYCRRLQYLQWLRMTLITSNLVECVSRILLIISRTLLYKSQKCLTEKSSFSLHLLNK